MADAAEIVRTHRGRGPDVEPVVEALYLARIRRGVSRAELAKRLGMAKVTIRSWETYERQPPLNHLRRWADALGVRLVVVDPAAEGGTDG